MDDSRDIAARVEGLRLTHSLGVLPCGVHRRVSRDSRGGGSRGVSDRGVLDRGVLVRGGAARGDVAHVAASSSAADVDDCVGLLGVCELEVKLPGDLAEEARLAEG